jgi:hypothetical protein
MENKLPITVEKKDSDTLVIAFTGFSNKLQLPTNQFFIESGLALCSRAVVFDPQRTSCLNGVMPDCPTLADVVKNLKEVIADISPKKIITVGTSGGGHSALLFGHLLKADLAVSFSPYPYISMKVGTELNDPMITEHPKAIVRYHKLPSEAAKYGDLKDVLCNWNSVTKYRVYAGRYNTIDALHASYLEGLPSMEVNWHESDAHSLAPKLSREGLLRSCFTLSEELEEA